VKRIVSARDQECIERHRAKIIEHSAGSAALTPRRKGKIIPRWCSRGQVRANDAGAQVFWFGSLAKISQGTAIPATSSGCAGSPRNGSMRRQREVQRPALRTVAPLRWRVHARGQLRTASFVQCRSWRDGAERAVAND
jgi:hypothetical protein